MSRLVNINGKFLQETAASISFQDLSVQRGYSVFDFFRLVRNQPLHLEDHLNRFFNSALEMRLPVPKTREEIKQLIHELIWENELPDSGIRIQLTGGEFADGSDFNAPSLIISQLAFPFPTQSMQDNGMHLLLHAHQRQLPQVKSTDYMMSIWLQPLLKENQADDFLYHNNGIITECPRSNFFMVSAEGKIVTPANNILKGITRMKVLMLASNYFQVEERDIHIDELQAATEAFITSTTKQIIPVTRINGKEVGNGQVGEVTKKLTTELRAYCGFD